MVEQRSEKCKRIYRESGLPDGEAAILKALFDSYGEAGQASEVLFLPGEIPFSNGVVRRGIFEKKLASVFSELGGRAESRYTTQKHSDRPTSHYSVYRLGLIEATISLVDDETRHARPALFRQSLIEAADMPFSFIPEEKPRDDAFVYALLKHGKDVVDSTIPQFAMFEVLDRRGFVVWRRNLLKSQRKYVEGLLDLRADVQSEHVRADEGIPKLRRHLRRLEAEGDSES